MNCYLENHSECIKSVPIFNSLSEKEMQEISNITTSKIFEKGETVYKAGDKGGTLFVLHTGRVKIARINQTGKEQVIRVAESGEFMGELSLFSSLSFTDNAEALENSTMFIVEGAKLKALMAKYTSIAFKIIDELSRRLEKAENLIETISLNTVEQRLAKTLLALAGEKEEIVLGITKGDFASQMGMSQETLSRKLTAFRDSGIIELFGRRNIRIKNKAALKAISLD